MRGQEFEVQIERMSYGPMAIARVRYAEDQKPMVVFVEGGAPGDTAKIRLTHQHKNYWEGEIVEILKPSPDRVSPPCRYFGSGASRCGGCQWQHLSYDAQLAAKKDILLHQLQRTTKIDRSTLEAITTAHAAAAPFGYRTRVQARGDRDGLGFFAKRSKQLIHIDSCAVLHPMLDQTWKNFQRPQDDLFKVEWTLTEEGEVLEAVNQAHAALGFTQVNAAGNAQLRGVVETLAAKSKNKTLLWDLYGGDGNLVRNLKSRFAKTVTVDSAVNTSVKTFLKSNPGVKPDCIITDPPRAGLEDCAEPIASRSAERVILVSCDPSTLAHDLSKFMKSYQIQSIHLIDMFPQTYHLEAVLELNIL